VFPRSLRNTNSSPFLLEQTNSDFDERDPAPLALQRQLAEYNKRYSTTDSNTTPSRAGSFREES
jgi:hypothetical protein